MSDESRGVQSSRAGALASLRVGLVVVGFGTSAYAALALPLSALLPDGVGAAIVGIAYVLLLAVGLSRVEQIRHALGATARPLADALFLVVLPAWGLFYNSAARHGLSRSGAAAHEHLALAEPEVLGLVALHTLSTLAYLVARRRKGALPFALEALLHGCLFVGVTLHALIAVQLRGLVLLGAIPPLLPLATPPLAISLFAGEALSRLRRRGAEADSARAIQPTDSAFRRGPAQPTLPPAARIHRPLLARSIVVAALLLGAWASVQRSLFGFAPLQAFTRTHGHTLSTAPSSMNAELRGAGD